ncbi:MAG TPA: AAA family ATPase [Bradyrhizobium sp.]|jgi:hypothetical protein|uniref:ATP-binding protein n=1 Tax=Bradyrhizobium sp. TaxID=376 RepID=UPI002B65710E|nr:AAA family ATPase [Bradyrhizobium sp.]HTA99826.1 AAA family ATPase [Bradyrhizobium sp.]
MSEQDNIAVSGAGNELPHHGPADHLVPPMRAAAPVELFWHRADDERAARPWLVKGLIPESGVGLLSGQWGTAKTFAAIDLAGSIMTGMDFAGYQVVRRGGVLLVAAEGAQEVPIRLQGIVERKLRLDPSAASSADLDQLPFAWIEECPSLKNDDGFERLVAATVAASAIMMKKAAVELVLIIIDTLSAVGDFDDQNAAAESQRIMNRLASLSRRTGAFALAVDHFGKTAESGTRGSSTKEASADVVLAMLAERDISGTLANTRMAVRKLRGGSTGAVTPFDLVMIDLCNGETTCVVDWRAEQTAEKVATSSKVTWPKGLRIFRAAMQTSILDHGKPTQPYGSGGPTVQAVANAFVRTEFMASYPADSETPRGQKAVKRSAFNRAVRDARERTLICSREIDAVDHLWLTADDGPDQARTERQ